MKAFYPFVATLFLLSACGQRLQVVSTQNSGERGFATCAGSSAPSCRFRNSPVKLENTPVRLPRRALVFYPTAEELDFVDAARRNWIAPRRTLTDGASIPRIFTSIIGDPKSPEFANAAAIHDAYCGVGNETGRFFHSTSWRQVHRMFYDALRVGGTSEIKAKIMFAAVYIGGPRWSTAHEGGPEGSLRVSASGGASPGVGGGPAAGGPGTAGAAGHGADAVLYGGSLDDLIREGGPSNARQTWTPAASEDGNRGLSPARMRTVLRQTIKFIEDKNPSLPQIEGYAEGLLSLARLQATSAGEAPDQGQGAGAGEDPATGSNDPVTGSGAPVSPGTATPSTGAPGVAGGDPATGGGAPVSPGTATPSTGAPGVAGSDPATGGTDPALAGSGTVGGVAGQI